MKHRAYFLVICARADGPIIYETMVDAMDRATVNRHIREKQFDNPARVVEFIPTLGTCRDATHEFLFADNEP